MSYTAKDYAEMAAKANAEGKILVVIEGELVLQDPPAPTQAEMDAQRRAEILEQLSAIDVDSVRPMRAMLDGSGTDADRDKLTALDAEATALRDELKTLSQEA